MAAASSGFRSSTTAQSSFLAGLTSSFSGLLKQVQFIRTVLKEATGRPI